MAVAVLTATVCVVVAILLVLLLIHLEAGGLSAWIARTVTLTLGRLTFAALHLFEKLGVEMADVDAILASWTAWSKDIQGKLADALATNAQLVATDAAQDAEQAAALQAEFAAKVQGAYDAAVSTPAVPPVTEPEPEAPVVVEPPVVEPEPVVDAPVEEPVVEPTPEPEAPVEDDVEHDGGSF